MNDMKPDLSREAVERMLMRLTKFGTIITVDAAHTLRALLDAKEAAEREGDEWRNLANITSDKLTKARASAGAAWEAGFDNGAGYGLHYGATLDPSATEALRRVKEAVWDEGYGKGYEAGTDHWPRPDNPYAAKEAAR